MAHRIYTMTRICVITVFIIVSYPNCDLITDSTGEIKHRIQDQILFFSSFESPQDTTGWWGYAAIELYDDAPPDGGNKSLSVSGGCIVPHAMYEFGPFPRDLEIILEAWGRAIHGGGGVSVGVKKSVENYQFIGFSVDQPEWTFYQSDESLSVKRGEKLSIHINAGGIVAGTILVDLLTIREIK